MGYCDSWIHSALDRNYHDYEWGEPVHDDRKQFEYLSLEVMQCGLSWELVLRKREIIRACFDNFDYDRISEYADADVGRILAAEGMIRSERKIRANISNAKCFRQVRDEFGTFDKYLWEYSGGKTILYKGHEFGKVPSSNGLSERISNDLRRRGFKYLGPVTVYAHLQACGIINDHDLNCPCYKRIVASNPTMALAPDNEKF